MTSNFRGYTATAPLKATSASYRETALSVFPWLHSHGPIEGGQDVGSAGCGADFRGYTAGPIEGAASASRRNCRAFHFRGYTATAPLKVRCFSPALTKSRYFRGYTATAPLKELNR